MRGNRRMRFYNEMYRNAVYGEGVCENPTGLSMSDGNQNGTENQAKTKKVWSGKRNKNDIKCVKRN